MDVQPIEKNTKKSKRIFGWALLIAGILVAGYLLLGYVEGASGYNTAASENLPVIKDGYQEIKMTVDRAGFTPNKFVLKKGVPVKWIIDGKELNSCNNAIQVPAYGLKFDVRQGEQLIEFTPTESGTIRWSCWMGMIPGTFIVKDDIDLSNTAAVKKELDSIPAKKAGTCGVSTSSGCGCGARR